MSGFAVDQSSPLNTSPPVKGFAEQPSAPAQAWATAAPIAEPAGLLLAVVVGGLAVVRLRRHRKAQAAVARRLVPRA